MGTFLFIPTHCIRRSW